MPSATSATTDVCILGAGPHGLAAAVHLRVANPELDITVLDHEAEWMAAWHRQFARAEITTLRSPIVHHPSPDPVGLMRYADQHGLGRSGLPYDVPTTNTFAAFCRALADDADLDPPIDAPPHALRSDGQAVQVETAAGTITASHAVVATNPHRRIIPDWTWPLVGHQPGLVEFGLDVDLRAVGDLDGQRVVIVGGGLTAAHLACGAAARGATVHLISRRELQIRGFDTDPGWLGPKYLSDYFGEQDTKRRLELCAQARNGGSIPGWMRDRLTDLVDDGTLVLHEATAVGSTDLGPAGTCMLELDDDTTVSAGRIWLATGTEPDIAALRCLRPLLEDVPTVDGLPVVDQRLRLGPHPVYVMGRLAMVALGPASGNLWGAQRAARRITHGITGVDLDLDTAAAGPRPLDRP